MRIISLIILWSLSGISERVLAQEMPDPKIAFFRSMLVPGWGHYYVDKEDWNRGKFHLGTELALIASYFGLHQRMNRLEERYTTIASLQAGVNIDGRSRAFQIAVGNYNDISEYNDFQLRSRNWNRLFDDTPENHWQWANETDKIRYNQLRSDRDNVRNQLPALIGLVAVNRLITALSAYNYAANVSPGPEISLIPVTDGAGSTGGAAMSVIFRF